MVTSQLLVMSALVLGATPRGVVYEFTASWCGPCQQMSPMVSRLERQGLPIKKIDVDKYRAFSAKYKITSIPAFVLVIDGKEAQRIVGATNEAKLREMFAKIPREAAPSKTGADVQLASNRSSAPPAGRGRVTPRPKKTRFHIPFLGKADDEPAVDISEATVRANIDEGDDAPAASQIATPMEASVRIRANNGTGINYGSGTIISSSNGRTMVLTCGHICRGMVKSGTMEIDIFSGQQRKTYVAKVVAYNEKADVGLLEFPSDENFPYTPVAPVGHGVKKGQAVASVGCGGGDDPTLQQHRVVSLNRYLGPDNIECTGEPIEGRSGGGLFDENGAVVGVCFARDPQDHRGLYAGLKPIQQLLDRCQLSHLYQPQTTTESNAPVIADNTEDNFGDEIVINDEDEQERVYTADDLDGAVAASEAAAMDELTSGVTDLDALQEALSKVGEAEVVCVVRPINNPRAASRVVILNRASDKFVKYLTNELESDPMYNTTSLRKSFPATKKTTNPNSPPAVIKPKQAPVAKTSAPSRILRRYRRQRAE